MKPKYPAKKAYESIAKSLRDFGYPDVTSSMVKDTHAAMIKGEPIPHDIVGAFAESQLKEALEMADLVGDV